MFLWLFCSGHSVGLRVKCSVLTAAHQSFNALPLSDGDWPVAAVVLFSLLFQS